MSQEPNREVAILNAALELSAAERSTYLEQACEGDAALHQRVEDLLRAHERAEGFMQEPPTCLKRTEIVSLPLTEKPGDKIGHYKLLQQIGEGGCGVVYMAEQEQPVRRRVALKIIKLGMDTKQVVARFEAERQALALMDHPNIARVLDAGSTETGRPYFVMELVRGIKITEFCDEKKLTTEERLKLFIQVCQAIQHAHQKGIIHRDIKPSNILVTINEPGSPGVPKVIDFGIAKATQGRLTDQTLFTAFEQFIGTPAYMSPEQAVMTALDIDTRSDIYSLGVLLYELLTGKTPFDQKDLLAAGLDEMRRTIREREPPKPSTRLSTMLDAEQEQAAIHHQTEPPQLIHMLRGDLDWIVMKCLEKDRARRYETANGLAFDVKRHLDNEPIVARPPSKLYRFQKSVQRNKLAFAAAAAVMTALIIGLGVSTWEYLKERQAHKRAITAEKIQNELREKAQTEATKSRQVAQFLKNMLQGVGPSVALGRDTQMLREVMNQTARHLSELKGQPAVEAELLETLGTVYRDLNEYTNAESMLTRSLDLRQGLYHGDDPGTASSLHEMGELFRQQNRDTEAEDYFRRALAMRQRLFTNENASVADSMFGLAEVMRRDSASRANEAEQLHREALAIRRKVLGSNDLDVASSLTGLAVLIKKSPEKIPEAEACLHEALSIQRAKENSESPDVAYTLSNLGVLLAASPGKRAEGEQMLREAVAIQKKLLGDHRETAASLYFLGQTVTNSAEAESLFRESLRIRRKVLGLDNVETARSLSALVAVLQAEGKQEDIRSLHQGVAEEERQGQSDESLATADGLMVRGKSFQSLHKPVEAEQCFRKALEILRQHGKQGAGKIPACMYGLAEALYTQFKTREAQKLYEDMIPALRQELGENSTIVAELLRRQGFLLHSYERRYAAAVDPYRQALAIRRARTNEALCTCLRELGVVLLDSRRPAEAERDLRESLTLYRSLHTNENIWGTAQTQLVIAMALEAQDKQPDAEHFYREALKAYANTEGIGKGGYNYTLLALGRLLASERKIEDAKSLLTNALSQEQQALGPQHVAVAATMFELATLLRSEHETDEATNWYRQVLEILPQARSADVWDLSGEGMVELTHGLPPAQARELCHKAALGDESSGDWLYRISHALLTNKDSTISDATCAMELSQKAVEMSYHRSPLFLDTLAAAYAACGQFTNAVHTQQEAMDALQSDEDKPEYLARLKFYESKTQERTAK
jgi:serine/threonine protein kinase/tetratricopeptide (TPR) repeat protein